LFPDQVYFEPAALNYPLGRYLKEKLSDVPWIPIQSHNNIQELRENPNSEFARMKRHIIVGVRKSLRYTPNHKVSDYLVPYTSSGCSAMCLYCYLVCNYNKCSYLRLFVNREQMMERLKKTAASDPALVFEIGSNSDLVLENDITQNLEWTIPEFAKEERGFLTFPTKFDSIDPLLVLDHRGRILPRMSVNPEEVIRRVEFGTSPLAKRITAVNRLCEAGYRTGILIAPVVLVEGWREQYAKLAETLADTLSEKAKKTLYIEIIFMTYSFVHRAINAQAFPNAIELYDTALMTGRGRGKYCYREDARAEGELFLRGLLERKLPEIPIVYVV
jgi:spore photoproduct lyase